MKRLHKTLAPLFLSLLFLAGIPSASLAYSLVEVPPQNVTIIDSGEVNCYVKSNLFFQPIGGVIYRSENWIYCKNSFLQTSVIISRIELKNHYKDEATQGVRIEVGGFPFLYEGINAEQSKILPVDSKIGPNLLNREVAKYYFEYVPADPLKIFVNINGEEKIINFLEVNQWKQEYLSTGSLKLNVVDFDALPPKIVYSPSEACVQEHGLNSTLVGGSCTCKDNYMFDNAQQCKPSGGVCVNEYGKGGIPSTAKDCSCANGYHLDGRHCIEDAKPIRYISASVKKWADDNYPFDTPCSSNKNFSADDIKVCSDYNTALYRVKYDWQISTPTIAIATPSIAPVAPPIVSSVSLPITQPKNTGIIAKPKTVQPIKPAEVKSTTTATTTGIQEASTTIEVIPPVVEEAQIQPPQLPIPPPAPKTFWSKVISWFKFW